jgi:hypothetical protein
MGVAAERPRILTENEKYGDSFLNESAGGVWIVLDNGFARTSVAFVATNRQAAEDAIYGKCERNTRAPEDFSIQVWSPESAYPTGEES